MNQQPQQQAQQQVQQQAQQQQHDVDILEDMLYKANKKNHPFWHKLEN